MKTRIHYSFLALLACSFLTFNAIAQVARPVPPPEPTPPTGPISEITFEETEYDFGIVQAGEKVRHTYTFTNTSDEILILINAKGSCGCTVPKWPKDPIAPGETASITVEFDSKNKKGMRNQKVTITANTDPPQTFLYLKGEVEVPENDLEISEIAPDADFTNMECIAIYPNPTSDVLKLDLKESIGKSATISIYSKKGQLMAKRTVENIEDIIEFRVDHYPAGAYIANVQIEGQERVARCFMVSH